MSQNIKKHDKDKRRVKDDSCTCMSSSSSSSRRVIRGIDDPLLNGSFSDSGVTRTKKHRRKSSWESGGESSSDQAYSGFEVAEKQNFQKGTRMTHGLGSYLDTDSKRLGAFLLFVQEAAFFYQPRNSLKHNERSNVILT
ncbi:Organic solute transporter subunit alpha/Transmembrane protein 184 protein [Raphanus sativus]|nr:Organic solute transporter subunit alpha/Transmembrane protein 184 protein [Raphanus sativus]